MKNNFNIQDLVERTKRQSKKRSSKRSQKSLPHKEEDLKQTYRGRLSSAHTQLGG